MDYEDQKKAFKKQN